MTKKRLKKLEPPTVQGICLKCRKNLQAPRGRGKYRTVCRRCNGKKRNKAADLRRREARRKRILCFITEYKSAHPCVDCGESDLIVLEFDHRDPAKKLFQISQCAKSLERTKAEIEKCDIRCCNCHRRRTVREKHGIHAPGINRKNGTK